LGRSPNGPAEVYLASLGPSSRPAAASACRRIAAVLGILDPREINGWSLEPEAVVAVCAALRQGAKPGYARRLQSVLAGILRASWRIGQMDGDKLARLLDSIPAVPGVDLPPGRALSPLEIDKLHYKGNATEQCMLALGIGAGLRRHEMAGLRCLDVRVIEPGYVILYVKGKGGKVRKVDVKGLNAETIRRRREGAPDEALLLGLSVEGVAKALARFSARICIPFTTHDLRRTFATRALAMGIPLHVVQDMLGHADPKTTIRYDRGQDQARADAAEKLALDIDREPS
jgi:integrase